MRQDTDNDYASAEDMHAWLKQEIKNSAKAHELRLKEAVGFVTEYALGKISPEEAAERYSRYVDRWGEGLFGAMAGENLTDDEIIASIDTAEKERLERIYGPHKPGGRSR